MRSPEGGAGEGGSVKARPAKGGKHAGPIALEVHNINSLPEFLDLVLSGKAHLGVIISSDFLSPSTQDVKQCRVPAAKCMNADVNACKYDSFGVKYGELFLPFAQDMFICPCGFQGDVSLLEICLFLTVALN